MTFGCQKEYEEIDTVEIQCPACRGNKYFRVWEPASRWYENKFSRGYFRQKDCSFCIGYGFVKSIEDYMIDWYSQ